MTKEREYLRGYQDALQDITDALINGGEPRVVEWLYDNMTRHNTWRQDLVAHRARMLDRSE